MTPALTLHQPWADLIVRGVKRYEFRSWAMPRRYILKPIAIHAGKTFDADGWATIRRFADAGLEGELGLTADAVGWADPLRNRHPAGAVVGRATFLASEPIRKIAANLGMDPDDCGDGFAWPVLEATRFDAPIPARGRQGIWTWDDPSGQPRDPSFLPLEG